MVKMIKNKLALPISANSWRKFWCTLTPITIQISTNKLVSFILVSETTLFKHINKFIDYFNAIQTGLELTAVFNISKLYKTVGLEN